MQTNNQGAFYMIKRTREQEIVTFEFQKYSIIITLIRLLLHFFPKHGGYVKRETTVVKKYSKDMEQDTLEILPGFTIKQKNSG